MNWKRKSAKGLWARQVSLLRSAAPASVPSDLAYTPKGIDARITLLWSPLARVTAHVHLVLKSLVCAQVYKAKCRPLDSYVAIKTVEFDKMTCDLVRSRPPLVANHTSVYT